MSDIDKTSLSLEDENSVSSKAISASYDLSTVNESKSDVEVGTKSSASSLPESVHATWTWLNSFIPWGSTETVRQPPNEISPSALSHSISINQGSTTPSTLIGSEPSASNSQAESNQVVDWFAGLFARPQVSSETQVSAGICPPDALDSGNSNHCELANVGPNETTQSVLSPLTTVSSMAIGGVHAGIAYALITGIRTVSSERDRDEIIRWFVKARDILGENTSTTQKATALYQSTDTVRFSQLLANTVGTSVNNYYGANLPLALKVAMPVTLIGAGYFGMQGAGLLAFGTGIGLPVVLLLFLGTAGVTTVIEAFIKDRHVRDPLTKLLLMFVAFETARRAKKELLDAMRADAMVPERATTPSDSDEVLAFLMQMDPIAFERHVMSFFELDGHPTGLTARSNDFGVDGYVFHPDGVIVVQCKRYGAENSVGRPAIQQFKGVIEEQRAFKGYFVTTSRFTDEAIESAAKSSRIILVNGEEIVRWHKEGRKPS